MLKPSAWHCCSNDNFNCCSANEDIKAGQDEVHSGGFHRTSATPLCDFGGVVLRQQKSATGQQVSSTTKVEASTAPCSTSGRRPKDRKCTFICDFADEGFEQVFDTCTERHVHPEQKRPPALHDHAAGHHSAADSSASVDERLESMFTFLEAAKAGQLTVSSDQLHKVLQKIEETRIWKKHPRLPSEQTHKVAELDAFMTKITKGVFA